MLRILVISLILTCFTPLLGQAEELSMNIQTQDGVSFVSGGIGQDQRDELQRIKGQFNLHLLFAVQQKGEYLSDVQVEITSSDGTSMLRTISAGPNFYAKLPSGRYKVTAERDAYTLSQSVSIGGGQRKSVVFRFPLKRGD